MNTRTGLGFIIAGGLMMLAGRIAMRSNPWFRGEHYGKQISFCCPAKVKNWANSWFRRHYEIARVDTDDYFSKIKYSERKKSPVVLEDGIYKVIRPEIKHKKIFIRKTFVYQPESKNKFHFFIKRLTDKEANEEIYNTMQWYIDLKKQGKIYEEPLQIITTAKACGTLKEDGTKSFFTGSSPREIIKDVEDFSFGQFSTRFGDYSEGNKVFYFSLENLENPCR